MANSAYNAGRVAFAKAQLNWETATIKALLIDTAYYTFDANHANLAAVNVSARVATQTLTNKVVLSTGACDADDTVFANVSGPTIEAVILYVDTGVESTSTLIAYLDTVTGLPFQPVGLSVTLTWDSGVNAIIRP